MIEPQQALLDAGITGEFRHREHLQLAWHVLRTSSDEATAIAEVREVIKALAAAHGDDGKYHETITVFWMRLLGHIADRNPEIIEFDELLASHPRLLDGAIVMEHWSPELLWSAGARGQWRPPDLAPLPG